MTAATPRSDPTRARRLHGRATLAQAREPKKRPSLWLRELDDENSRYPVAGRMDCRIAATQGGEFELSGVPRMHERPIGDLVDALRPLVEALAEHALFAEEVALTIEARAAMIADKEPMKARRLTADALHTVRTRARDIAEARAVTTQALSLRALVSGTNAQLIAAIDKALAAPAATR